MSHLVVSRETIIEQENGSNSNESKTRSIGKHPRMAEPKQFGAIGNETKRKALGSITNTLSISQNSSKYGSSLGELLPHKTTLQASLLVRFTLECVVYLAFKHS